MEKFKNWIKDSKIKARENKVVFILFIILAAFFGAVTVFNGYSIIYHFLGKDINSAVSVNPFMSFLRLIFYLILFFVFFFLAVREDKKYGKDKEKKN